MNETWWCANCRTSVELDMHLRCECCGSEAVDPMGRPSFQATASVACTMPVTLLPQYAGTL